MRKMITIALVMMVAAAAGAQSVDPAAAFTAVGPVVELASGRGPGGTVLVVDDAARGQVSVSLAPIWYLEQAGFAAAAGEQVEVVAFPCSACANDGVAVRVMNLTTGAEIVLRDETGAPLWSRGGREMRGQQRMQRGPGGGVRSGGMAMHGAKGAGRQGGARCAGEGLDVAAARTLTGDVVRFDGAARQRFPSLVLDTAEGELTVMASPYRMLAAAGLELAAGDRVEVTFAPAVGDPQHLVALSVTDLGADVTVQLRDAATGQPLGGRGPHRGAGRGHGGGFGPGSGSCPRGN